jgi:putative DNA primase/helicase
MNILDIRLAMVAHGYTPIPVVGKKPPLQAWQKITAVSHVMLEAWGRDWPCASNTGVLTRLTPTLDLDLLNEPAALAAENLVRERFETRGRILSRVGFAPKRAIPFRTSQPFKKLISLFAVSAGADPNKSEKIEFLGDGQQFVAHGIHPDTQREYVWAGGDPSTVAYNELPEISVVEAAQLQIDIVALLARDFGYVIAKDQAANGGAPGKRGRAARNNMARDEAWARAALEAECAKIAAAPPGTRNAALNLGAYNVFQIVHGNPGLLDEAEVRARLFAAAEACGLVADDGADSAWRTIDSGSAGAQSQPRVRPQQAAITGLGLATAGIGAATPAPGMRRVIQLIEGERFRIVDEAEEALIAAGGFDIYQRDAAMVRPVMNRLRAANRHGMKRVTAAWRLMTVKPLYLVEMLGRVARFQTYDRRRKDWIDKDCPNVIGETLLAREGTWNVPVLLGVVHIPQLRADGSLLTTPGYDPQTQLLFKPDGEHFPDITDQPTQEDAQRAMETVKQAIATFPFKTEADRSVALSLLLTGVCRRTLDFAPLHAITSPAAGTGKSLLIDLASILLSGQPAPVLSAEIDAAEFEKRLGSSLMAGDAVISFDNCSKPLDQGLLCQALSQSRLNLRLLGYSQNRDVTMSALLTATGNNLILQGDLPRRSLRCEIDAKVERPELRVFPGAHIQTEFRRRRGELVAALLTILRAYHVAVPLPERTPLGGFEMWSHWVRDALIWLGCADPCSTIELIRAGNPERERHEAVVLAWRDHFGLSTIVTVRDLIEASTPGQYVLQQPSTSQRLYDALHAVAEDHRHHGSISNDRLGRWLGKVNGKFEKGLRIVRIGSRNGYPLWELQS